VGFLSSALDAGPLHVTQLGMVGVCRVRKSAMTVECAIAPTGTILLRKQQNYVFAVHIQVFNSVI
jgi:hypothetical protein